VYLPYRFQIANKDVVATDDPKVHFIMKAISSIMIAARPCTVVTLVNYTDRIPE